MKDRTQTFIEKLHECNQYKKRLIGAKSKLKSIMPLSLEQYNNLDDIFISIIDQMIFRFSKLQGTIGEKVIPTLLELHGEEVKKMTFIDRLNRLEELGPLYKDDWMGLRKDRNEIAHEYSFNQNEVIDSINLIFTRVDDLLKIYDDIFIYCEDKFEFVRSSEILQKTCLISEGK